MRTLGVDLAADARNTGVCEVDWDACGGSVLVVEGPHDDDRLVASIIGADKVGVDVPLGWPEPFVEALVAHAGHAPWPGRDRRELRLRRTDVAVRDACGLNPLSVSSDRIGVPAMRWAALEDRLRCDGPVDRSGGGRVVEVYPAGALKLWGLPHRAYKRPDQRAALAALVAALQARARLGLDAGAEEALRTSDHAFDALVAALIARAAALGRTTRPPPDARALARREGWVHLPTCDLADL
jgi:predicted nuclease with RNAse H fold